MESAIKVKKLEVIVASSAGTCFGVEMAIDLAEQKRKPGRHGVAKEKKVEHDRVADRHSRP